MTLIAEVIRKHEADLTSDWIQEMASSTRRSDLMKDSELKNQATQFVKALSSAVEGGNTEDINGRNFDSVRDLLDEISSSRANKGFSPTETAMFVFSLKRPLFARIRQELGTDAAGLAEATWVATELLGKFVAHGLFSLKAMTQGM